MAGMLEQAQAGQQPPEAQSSSGPMQTPPEAVSGAENPPRDGASGSGQPIPTEELNKQAIKFVYGERFDQLIKMFETNGEEKFARSMAIAINGAFDNLQKNNGDIPLEQIAEVGMTLMFKLLEDIISKGVLPNVTLEQTKQVIPATLVMYADSHPNVSKEDIQMLIKNIDGEMSAQGGGQPPAEPMPGEQPQQAPPPAQMPPGAI
tara:strand:+ start:344 stop:958 length:615 start_codon:yes stop_codon:yes gene_type:complete